MFRMLQALEREPQEEPRSSSATRSFAGNPMCIPTVPGSHPPGVPGDPNRSLNRDNPHKYLLYKPTVHQLLVFLSCGFKELPANGVLLLYLSADGSFGCASHQAYPPGAGPPPQPAPGSMGMAAGAVSGSYYGMQSLTGLPPGYEHGGVSCNNRCAEQTVIARNNLIGASIEPQQLIDTNCLHPGDLFVFLRKPFFLIVDSDNSHVFQQLPRLFGQPMLVLMSPEEAPPPFQQQQQQHGSLFTLFLHCPLTALCLISNIIEMPLQIWDKAQIGVDRFLLEAGRLLMRSRSVDPVFIHFYADDFLRLLILRFIFCSVLLRMHRLFRVSLVKCRRWKRVTSRSTKKNRSVFVASFNSRLFLTFDLHATGPNVCALRTPATAGPGNHWASGASKSCSRNSDHIGYSIAFHRNRRARVNDELTRPHEIGWIFHLKPKRPTRQHERTQYTRLAIVISFLNLPFLSVDI